MTRVWPEAALAALTCAALLAAGPVAPAAARPTACGEFPDPLRWLDAGTPDSGQARPLIMPHRGGGYLAPEETREAYEVSLAYGSDGFEGDLQVSKDGEFILSHDATLGRLANNGKRDGGPLDPAIADLTVAELKRFNMANHGDFALSAPANPKQAFNPAQILTLREALAIADRHDVGMDLDLKNVPDPAVLVNLVAEYPRAFRHTFFESDPHEVLLMRQAQPDANAMYNLGGQEPPGTLYALTQAPWRYRYFGSALAKFTPERVAEMHDGCALAIPHDYDDYGTGPDEPRALREGRANGTDGAQVNHVEQATPVYGRPVTTRLEVRGTRTAPEVCLLNGERGLGIPYKPLKVGRAEVLTLREGCVRLTRKARPGTTVRFAGDDTARASSGLIGTRARARRHARRHP